MSQALGYTSHVTSSKIALQINSAIMESATNIWQTPATIPPTCKRSDKKYYIPSKGMESLFTCPQTNSLATDAVNKRGKQRYSRTTHYDKEWKRLDLLGRKAYSSTTLHFRVANYEAFMAKYDHKNYSKFSDFIDYIPEDKREQFT